MWKPKKPKPRAPVAIDCPRSEWLMALREDLRRFAATHDSKDPEEVADEAVARLLLKKPRLVGKEGGRRWAFHVANHLMADGGRRRQNRVEAATGGSEDALEACPATDAEEVAERDIQAKAEREAVLRELEPRLSETEKRVLACLKDGCDNVGDIKRRTRLAPSTIRKSRQRIGLKAASVAREWQAKRNLERSSVVGVRPQGPELPKSRTP